MAPAAYPLPLQFPRHARNQNISDIHLLSIAPVPGEHFVCAFGMNLTDSLKEMDFLKNVSFIWKS
jgi:hypothetical protein